MKDKSLHLKDRITNKFKKVIAVLKSWWETVRPLPGAERGAVIAIGIVVTLAVAVRAYFQRSGLGFFIDAAFSILVGGLGFILVYFGVRMVMAVVLLLPRKLIAGLGVGFAAMLVFFNIYEGAVWHISLGVVIVTAVVGAVIYDLSKGGWRSARLLKRVLIILALVSGIIGYAVFFLWFGYLGNTDYLLDIEPYQSAPLIHASNPALPGDYEIKTLTYGSGTDNRRPEYGEEVDLVTRSVDASSLWWMGGGIEEKIRRWYWGFGTEDFPINGRVWYPEGDGPYPLVLMVHGNHNMSDYSDPGYAYLGELLASRGYIFVSVDQNFLNLYLTGRVGGENDARAWMLLKHLEVWEVWNEDLSSLFYNKVDMDNIALIGHSRGGEAVVLAAVFNHLERYPDDAKIKLEFNFNIRSVIAIAPVDQQYTPADQPAVLKDTNYLVLQGGHDADVSVYYGARQLERIEFLDPTSGLFKAGLYIYQANHGQFNAGWGRWDLDQPIARLLNTAGLLSGEEQRQIASVYISAFLDATLRGVWEFVPLFQDYRTAGDWLPPTLYINQYGDSSYKMVATYEEDYDVTTTTLDYGSVKGSHLSTWKEENLLFRKYNSQDNQVVVLGWYGSSANYTISLPYFLALDWQLGRSDYLVFNVADGRPGDKEIEQLDFSIVLEDSRGVTASIPLSSIMPLLPQLPVQFTRLPVWEVDRFKNPSEPVFQSYRIPLELFLKANPDIQLENITKICFCFDRSVSGRIILDNIGFSLFP